MKVFSYDVFKQLGLRLVMKKPDGDVVSYSFGALTNFESRPSGLFLPRVSGVSVQLADEGIFEVFAPPKVTGLRLTKSKVDPSVFNDVAYAARAENVWRSRFDGWLLAVKPDTQRRLFT